MGLFSKKESVPELPPAPQLPDFPKKVEEKKDLGGLPSFPNGKKNENMNQEIIKSAVSDDFSPGENRVIVDIPEDIHIKEETIPKLPKKAIEMEGKRTLELNAHIRDKPVTKSMEPIFVRIDKFQASQKNFKEIKNKVSEIETVLKKIKDVKTKEEAEISKWTVEVEKLKSRLAEIDSDIFSQV